MRLGLDTFTMKTGACLHIAVNKLGVIVGVNYIISYQQCLLLCPKICKLAICDDA